jgi:hypothetical protein
METCFSETSIGFYRSARRYIPEDRILHGRWYKNLKSNLLFFNWIDIKDYYDFSNKL